MQAIDSLIVWSGTNRSTVGICEQFIHGPAVGPPYLGSGHRALALRQGPMRGRLHMGYVEKRIAVISSAENLATRTIARWSSVRSALEWKKSNQDRGSIPHLLGGVAALLNQSMIMRLRSSRFVGNGWPSRS